MRSVHDKMCRRVQLDNCTLESNEYNRMACVQGYMRPQYTGINVFFETTSYLWLDVEPAMAVCARTRMAHLCAVHSSRTLFSCAAALSVCGSDLV